MEHRQYGHQNGSKKFGLINRLALLPGQGQISWLKDRNDKYTMYSHSHFLPNCALNNRNVDTSRTVILKTTWNFRLVHKTLLKIDY